MRRKRVAQRMWGDSLRDTRNPDILAQNLPCAHSAERCAARIEREATPARATVELGPQLTEVHGSRADRSATNWHQSLFAPLAEHPQQPLVHEQVTRAKRDPFRHAKPRPIRQF